MENEDNFAIEEVSPRLFHLRVDDILIGVLRLTNAWGVETSDRLRAFVIREAGEGPDIEIVLVVVRCPHIFMPESGIFNSYGDRLGDVGPTPYPDNTFPVHFVRN